MSKVRVHNGQEGLTLLQMAVVMVVMGMMVAAIMPMLTQRYKKDMVKQEKSLVRAARAEIIGYAVAHGKLPSRGYDFGHKISKAWNAIIYVPVAGVDKGEALAGQDMVNTDVSVRIGTQTLHNIAFFVVNKGKNHGSGEDFSYSAGDSNVVILPYDKHGFDDIVDFATLNYLKAKCQ